MVQRSVKCAVTAKPPVAKGLLSSCIMLGLLACAPSSRIGASPQEKPPSREQILVSPQSHVCVSVHADQRIWPRPLNPEVARTLSGNLMVGLRRIYEQRGGSDRMPGRNSGQRFHADPFGIDPACQDHDTDVFVKVQYEPRENGKPFLMRYRIIRDSSARAGSIDVNVAEEIRAGRIDGYSRDRNDGTIIGEDTLRRAELISNHLEMAPR